MPSARSGSTLAHWRRWERWSVCTLTPMTSAISTGGTIAVLLARRPSRRPDRCDRTATSARRPTTSPTARRSSTAGKPRQSKSAEVLGIHRVELARLQGLRHDGLGRQRRPGVVPPGRRRQRPRSGSPQILSGRAGRRLHHYDWHGNLRPPRSRQGPHRRDAGSRTRRTPDAHPAGDGESRCDGRDDRRGEGGRASTWVAGRRGRRRLRSRRARPTTGTRSANPRRTLTLCVDVSDWADLQASVDALSSQPDHRLVVLSRDAGRGVRHGVRSPSGSSSPTARRRSATAGSSTDSAWSVRCSSSSNQDLGCPRRRPQRRCMIDG